VKTAQGYDKTIKERELRRPKEGQRFPRQGFLERSKNILSVYLMDDDDDAVICYRALRMRGGWFGGTGKKHTRERQDCYLGGMSWGNCISHQNRGHTIAGL
jgi:hypothetical protein